MIPFIDFLLLQLSGANYVFPLQFSTHDVVVLKLSKADLGSPALGQGVVYRLKVTTMTSVSESKSGGFCSLLHRTSLLCISYNSRFICVLTGLLNNSCF